MNETTRTDALLIVVVFGATVAYLASLPHNLGAADESYFLYEAKRLRDGELLYRDVFQYVTPLSSYCMAGLYLLFGTTMTTARVAMAVIHGLIAVFTYTAARALGIRSGLCAAAAVAQVAIAQPAWPFASWHWFSTCVASAVVWALMRGASGGSVGRVFGLGMLCGVLLAVQQQRGLLPTAAIGVLILIEPLFDAIYGRVPAWRSSVIAAATYTVGVATILVPVLLLFVYLAGFEPVYHALVRFPLENYRASAPLVSWGLVTGMTAAYAAATFPRVLSFLPAAAIVPLARGVTTLVRRASRTVARQSAALVVVGGATVASIWYNNDFIHIAFIAAPFFIMAVLGVQWLLDLSLPGPARPWVQSATALALIASMAVHLSSNMRRAWREYPHTHETAFGRVEFRSPDEWAVIDALRTRLAQRPSSEIFCYANLAAPYLTSGGRNPTPFQHFSAWVFPPGDVARVLATLEERRVAYIVAVIVALRPNDPIAALIQRDYRAVPLSGLVEGKVPPYLLYERKEL